jgi:hypothetical protein
LFTAFLRGGCFARQFWTACTGKSRRISSNPEPPTSSKTDFSSVSVNEVAMEEYEYEIDEDLFKLSAMGNKERNALKNFLVNSKNGTEIETLCLWAAVARIILLARSLHSQNIALERKIGSFLRDNKKQSHFIITILILLVMFFGIATFRDFKITVEPYENSVVAINTSWWGLVSKAKEIKWMQPSGYDSPGWMAKDEKGEWYLFIKEDIYDEPPHE